MGAARDYLRRKKKEFKETWKMLAGEGHCDDAGGAEYRRVLFEWFEVDCPPAIEFICRRANIDAYGNEPKQHMP